MWYNNQSFSKLAELQVLKYKIPLNVDEQPENNTFTESVLGNMFAFFITFALFNMTRRVPLDEFGRVSAKVLPVGPVAP